MRPTILGSLNSSLGASLASVACSPSAAFSSYLEASAAFSLLRGYLAALASVFISSYFFSGSAYSLGVSALSDLS